jgi:hypothetical protein
LLLLLLDVGVPIFQPIVRRDADAITLFLMTGMSAGVTSKQSDSSESEGRMT